MKQIHIITLALLLVLAPTVNGNESAMLKTNNASIYYETAGRGQGIIFIHAGVADSRQWNNEFIRLSKKYYVVRYDMRGFGKSEPVDGEFTHLNDLIALLSHLNIDHPVILVGCSMGGSIALDYVLAEPEKVKALILVDSAPSGLQLDIPIPAKFKLVEEADKAGDISLIVELETQIWFDGDRKTSSVNQDIRQLAYDMNLVALMHDAKKLGNRLPDSQIHAVKRLAEIIIPVLAIVGENDIPYMHAAVNYLATKIKHYRTVTIENAAHLPNMDQPELFEILLLDFIESDLVRNF
ncbi:MAG: alpha/beta hydrolase [Pseudomonadales bacterium]|nr:alpha/beta hydrolase [Pseudomonadales bacterium]